MVYEDARWIRRPGEGWQAAASELREASCTIFIPREARTMYLFFQPQLPACDGNTLPNVDSIGLALSPDQPGSAYNAARQKLDQAGFRKVADLRAADPRVELYRR
jgi:hypothetical protein